MFIEDGADGPGIVIVDWKTGRNEGRFNEVQVAGYALYATEKGWAQDPEEISTELNYLVIPKAVRRTVDRKRIERALKEYRFMFADEEMVATLGPDPLRDDAVEIVGYLPDQLVLTGFRITPVVARISGSFEPRPDHREVQDCFVLPWMQLLDPASQVEVQRPILGQTLSMRDIHFREHRIWGATAGILLTLLDLVRE